MFSKNIEFVLIITVFSVMSYFSLQLDASCDMAAMMAKTGYSISTIAVGPGDYDEPDEFINFLIDYSSAGFNHDGYGITYIGEDGFFQIESTTNPTIVEFYSIYGQAWYVTAYPS